MEIYNTKTETQLSNQLFSFEIDKKQKEIDIQRKDLLLQEAALKRQRFIQLTLIIGLSFGVLFAIIFFLQRNRISKEKDRSESLLLNILPLEVAEELKEKGHADAQLIEDVTVLFTDFKGFTTIAEQLSPKDLVNDLNICFSEFDRIMQKYGIEKIKTIGDAYMAAGGLPNPNNTHALDVVQAAFEMLDFVEERKVKKTEAGLPYFEVRIGVHSGPVVAGIVGIKKFQYDIWGDTVNTASRMESSGVVEKINISQSTFELLKDDPDFTFESRGKIEAKGKGEIEMYFVSKTEMKKNGIQSL